LDFDVILLFWGLGTNSHISEQIHALIALATPSEKSQPSKRRSGSKVDQEPLLKA
jgi:hypothetical protein